jgi:hypothetical protein
MCKEGTVGRGNPGDLSGVPLEGIDTFAYIRRHEVEHYKFSCLYWPNDRTDTADGDEKGQGVTLVGDYIPDVGEAPSDFFASKAGQPDLFHPTARDSDGDEDIDIDDYVMGMQMQPGWDQHAADGEEWSSYEGESAPAGLGLNWGK